jgi:hypothetical protein
VGWNHEGYTAKCYSTGSVSGTGWNLGGLVGYKDPDEGSVREMSTFTTAGWDFVEIWDIGENQTYPYLCREPAGDLNHDKKVNFVDLAIFASHWLEGM